MKTPHVAALLPRGEAVGGYGQRVATDMRARLPLEGGASIRCTCNCRRAAPRRSLAGHVGLATAALLCLAAGLSLAAVGRTVVSHQRIEGHMVRHAVAFEAAEAGLDWALAKLGSPMAIDGACAPADASPGARSFLQTYLQVDASSRVVTPATGHDASGAVIPWQPTCTRASTGAGAPAPPWDCRCPSDDHPATASLPAGDGALHATFTVRFEAASAPGAWQVTSIGCTQAAGACAPENGAADAEARVHAVQALLPALTSLPSAALTAIGDVRSVAGLDVRNPSAWSGGIAVQAGGEVDLAHAVLAGPGGATASDRLSLSHDAGLSTTTGNQLFRRLTTLDKPTWQRLTAVQSVACAGDCGAALSAAAAHLPGPALLRVEGDVWLSGPLALGTEARPVLLVVAGRLTLIGGVRIAGLVEARDVVWDHAASGADDGGVQGAVVSEGDYGGTGAPRLAYDLGVLERLRLAGQHVRVPGGWRDF